MLETKCVGDGFGHFVHQRQLSFYISVGHQHSKDVTKIEILSPTSKSCRQLLVTDITLTVAKTFQVDKNLEFKNVTLAILHLKIDFFYEFLFYFYF